MNIRLSPYIPAAVNAGTGIDRTRPKLIKDPMVNIAPNDMINAPSLGPHQRGAYTYIHACMMPKAKLLKTFRSRNEKMSIFYPAACARMRFSNRDGDLDCCQTYLRSDANCHLLQVLCQSHFKAEVCGTPLKAKALLRAKNPGPL